MTSIVQAQKESRSKYWRWNVGRAHVECGVPSRGYIFIPELFELINKQAEE